MSSIPDRFRAFVAEKTDDGVERGVRDFAAADLPGGEVELRVAWSSVNYKDALATIADGKVARIDPIIPGIDMAGEVIRSGSAEFGPGDAVLAHGYDLGVSRHGGFADYERLPADYLVPLPSGLTARDAMAIGTAGFTAAMSVAALEERGLKPGDGPVLVTGASGGVGSVAVPLLAARGHRVVASTGRTEEAEYLRSRGAAEIIPREELSRPGKPLGKERWAGVVDSVGSHTLANACATTRYGGAVAACGLAAGMDFPATVAPFILRGVTLYGIDSVRAPAERRQEAWRRLASDLDPAKIEAMTTEVALGEVPAAAETLLAGRVRGRIVVDVNR
jgi:acrylyl-CoA reductase (NADPH)